ncbi:MAG: beta-propeller fold lactonase family protein [Candidatus Hydrogenedentes bacterium]|nr:beta-propeller fold lactonase family protein [Candidatus Hydrogenedentota bacterium]
MTFSAFSQTFINYESSHVHPIDVSPDGNTLAVCNTADNRIQIFDISSGVPVRPLPPLIDHVQVGIDPVSVRFLSNTELWAVNVLSDTISVIDLTTGLVRQTISTLDEPADVIFAGSPLKAFVTCSAVDIVQVFDATNPALGPLASIAIDGEDPRALAVDPTGSRVFVAIFESGNHSTILSGNLISPSPPIFPNAVGSPNSPYAGSPNPPPNSGASFFPPINPALPTPPGVSMIVKKNVGTGQWMDDNGGDWSSIVDGVNSLDSGRVFGWDMLDNDVAVIDTASFAVTYATGMMNICMAIAFNPATSSVTVVGIDATNEIRFEPNITGTFIRDNLATFVDGAPGTVTVNDMNVTHLDAAQGGGGLAYMDGDVPQAERDKSIGDPRGVVWMASGRGYVSGMGSNNVLPLTSASTRTSTGATIGVGEGPTGLALNPAETHLYVLNKFAGSVSTIDTTTDTVMATINFFDPSPPAIKLGRKHFYNTHKTSGLGHIACASCHIDGKMDRLAWDLGDPAGVMDPVELATHNMGMGLPGLDTGIFTSPAWEDSHPMKGPMTTQTFQDIIGKEPFHWRGDRQGLESFNPAFIGLNGDDTLLTAAEMQEFEDFVATIYFPPNPFRNLDNSLPTSVPLAGQFSTGRFSGSGGLNRGDPMPPGNPQRGLRLYMGTESPNFNMDGIVNCVTCHSLPIGNGADSIFNSGTGVFDPIPVGPLGNHHIGMVSTDTAKNIAIKTPHTRNVLDKSGYSNAVTPSRAGFGFFHDGSIDSVTTFLSSPVFNQLNDQDIADLVALMFAFSGSDFGNPTQNPPVLLSLFTVPLPEEPPSLQTSKDTHAAVGQQQTINTPLASLTLINQYIDLADANAVDLTVNGNLGGNRRSWLHTTGASSGTPMFQSDRAGETIDRTGLLALAGVGTELTFTVVHFGTGSRLALDRDGDTAFNFDEVVAGSDPADPTSLPGGLPLGWPSTALAMLALAVLAGWRLRRI